MSITIATPVHHRAGSAAWTSRCFTAALVIMVVVKPLMAETPAAATRAAEPSTPAAEYGMGVRSTPWLSPEDERAGLHLPPDFEVRLFAAEPQIAKPLNMAFDHRGRLWVTNSVAYPYPAANEATASDAVMVLADTDGDGLADEATTFADRLNIPMGVLPYGEGCLCFSIPNILYLRDTDGDGTCDKREVILGPFDTTRDTHGMINAMRDGGDGWIYACHGFNNQSEVAGSDGHKVRMPSGNTFRFRPDGSRIEVFTHGQVNPFGMTEDQWGYRYSADCHSKPITQLIRDACYPSFGRPHDGLGFLPPTVDHLHGSTAIGGILYITPEAPIEPLRNQFISGNVMTSRLNRDLLSFSGATAKGVELPDFLTSDDPWFRPVDMQLGPDGCIYVADFYNRIIGHYEVPLDHPGRDRTSGRIWQIRYAGDDAAAIQGPESTTLVDQLRSTNPTRRRLAERSTDTEAVGRLAFDRNEPSYARVAAVRGLRSAGKLDEKTLADLCVSDDARVRIEAFHLATERSGSSKLLHIAAVDALSDSSAHVVRGAAELLGIHGTDKDADVLYAALSRTDSGDPVLRQTIRIALRNLYRDAASDSLVWQRTPDDEFASLMLGLERKEMTPGLLRYLSEHPSAAHRDELLQHAARHATVDTLAQCVAVAKRMTTGVEAQFQLLRSLADSQHARSGELPAPIHDWATELVNIELNRFEEAANHATQVAWTTGDGVPWPQQERKLASGESALLVDSIGRGEQYTGTMRSDAFAADGEVRFWLAGHNGFPGKQDHQKNMVRLIDAATGEILLEALPPRNDIARQVRWDTSHFAGRDVRIECVDGDSAGAYAWLAIGQFEPAWIMNLRPNESLLAATTWIKRLRLFDQEQRLRGYLDDGHLSPSLRIDVARTIASLHEQAEASVVLQFLSRGGANHELTDQVIAATLSGDLGALMQSTKLLCKELTSAQQREFALAWVQGGADAGSLLQICSVGSISPAVLSDPDVRQSLLPRLKGDQLAQVDTLTEGIEVDEQLTALVARLRQSVVAETGDSVRGQQVFQKHCAACHQLRGVGSVIGPQLDGAVTRSRERLLEDIVMPDRNVDPAFRTTSLLLDDGRVIVGLVKTENEDEISLIDPAGKVVKVDPQAVEQRSNAGRSLMSSNFGELLTPADIGDLLKFIRGT